MKLGADVEFIIRSKATRLPVSMQGKLGGTKADPMRVCHGAIQEDGVLAEINIDPAVSLFDWQRNISMVLKELESRVDRLGCYVDYQSIEAEYPDAELRHPLAWESGCDPDYSIITGLRNSPHEFRDNLRMAGGHVHVELPARVRENPEAFRRSVGSLDAVLFAALSTHDPENRRSLSFGNRGNYRPKPYGAELRSPSNRWISSPRMRGYVWFLVGISLKYNLRDLPHVLAERLSSLGWDYKHYLFNRLSRKYEVADTSTIDIKLPHGVAVAESGGIPIPKEWKKEWGKVMFPHPVGDEDIFSPLLLDEDEEDYEDEEP